MFAALAVVLCAAGCAGRSTTASTASASPRAPSPVSTTAPLAAKTRVPYATRATAAPRRITGPRSVDVPRAAGTPARPVVPPKPQILAASVSPPVVRSGTVVRATVRTTTGVVTVVAHAGGVAIPVPRVGPGLFAGSTTIPPLPPFVHGSYPVTFVARDARGASTQSAVGVSVR